ncbi:gliding motility-associated C-terminal domain-containing protein [Mucilaginibacter sp. ZT4R22]|uniref:Gliding motility-associated C-terminal domain-containing protein n=1 Tax=Mucilaginibacter pankratovii TaxID=2772110 RepID=A0ABR7WKL8_9SPHI|nr:gliding motility-associated C-terminal domain-containing protein [Mucilaginibacter pankratovii]MBD1362866.1 gliding motility-associated C-terminal domain-containing protein [Mucilaginibacter pankratovii]
MMNNLTLSRILLPKFSRHKFKAIALALVLASTTLASFASKPTAVADRRSNTAFASTITSFSPASGAPGTLVTVTGSGFTSASTLTIGGVPAIVTSFTATQIVGMVMPGAVTGKVTVNTGINVSSATDFIVTATPYPAFQQGAKLIDTTIKYGPYNLVQTSALAADGNSALVNGGSSYLFYARKNNTWTVSSAFTGSNRYRTVSNYLALSADGSTALIGADAGPAKLYKRNNSAWQDAGTLNDSLGNVVGLSADGKTAILGKNTYGGSYSGGETGLGITIMKLVGNTWQKQEVADVPNYTEEHVYYGMLRFDEEGNLINTPIYYTVGRSAPGNRVAISADGKTAAASSFQNAGRYNRLFNLGYTAIYKLLSTGWEVQAVLPQYRDFKFSADGNTFLAGGDVYSRNGAVWSLQQTLPYGGGSMSADGNTIVFAAPTPTAYIRTGNGWVQKEIPAPNPAAVATENSLNNIALSADGATAFFEVPDDATRKGQSGSPLGSITVYGTEPYNPLDYATTITFSNTTDKTTTLSWPRGNGTTNRAVFLKMGTAGLPAAIKGTAYAPDSSFMSLGSYVKGGVAATGWYCVYNGKGGYVNITGLKTGTTYTASVVEYTGSAGAETYQVTGVTTRVTTPIVAPNYTTFVRANPGKNPATMMDIEYFPFGPPPVGLAIFVKEIGLVSSTAYPWNYSEMPLPGTASYAANNKFGTGEQIGNSGWFCVYNGEYSQNAVSVTGLRPAAYYRVVAVNYNGSKTIPVYTEPEYMGNTGNTYRTNSFDPPTGYATALTFSNTTATSSTLSWTNGTGASRAVFIKAGSLGAPALLDGYFPTASNPYTQGEPIDSSGDNQNWYCVYTGTGNSVNLLGLSPSTTYRVAVVDYNGDSGLATVAFVARFNGANVTTPAPVGAPATPPTGYATAYVFSNTAATSTTLSWAKSNGSARAVFLHLGTSGALNVVQGRTYTGNSTFKLGTQAGTNGWYCVYNGTGSSVNIKGLIASSTYRAILLEYNGTAGSEGYNLSRYNAANVTTTVAPVMLLTTNQKRMLVEQDVLTDDAAAELNVHQGVSPNGDGVNDVFTIDGIGAYPENILKVINNNGDVIYSATGYNNYSKAFDGRAANGTLQKAGTYFYSLEYKKGAEVIRKTGYLILKF